ncbi:MAG: LCP family protein [Oscillibacter sp.]|nr:LCP family protein [Oscillibacter sp.]
MSRYRGKHAGENEFYPEDASPEQGGRGKKHRRRLTRKQKGLVALCVVLAVSIVGVAAWQMLFVRPDLPGLKPDSSAQTGDSSLAPLASGERKSKDYYTILLLGRDTGGGGNTDTMMLCSYDVTNQKMTVMSIPRDTMVNVPWDIKKINSVYNQKGGGDKGIHALYQEIAQLVGFEPDFQVVVEWEAVGKLVDAVGGVYYDVPRNMDYEDPYQDLSIHIKKGYQKLNGSQAMGVVRFRDGKNGYADGDLGRIKTQQGFMKAVIKQLLQVKNVTKIEKFAKIFNENVKTDLSVQNLFWFGKAAILGGLSMDNVNFVTMPNENVSCWSRIYRQYMSYVVPKADELLELVNSDLSPFVKASVMSQLDIMSVNANGSISSTTGHVEDSKATVKPSVPAGTSTKPVDKEPDVIQPEDPSSNESDGTSGETGTGNTGGTSGETGTGTGGETGPGDTGSTSGETGTGTGGETGTETGGTAVPPAATEPTVPQTPAEVDPAPAQDAAQ